MVKGCQGSGKCKVQNSVSTVLPLSRGREGGREELLPYLYLPVHAQTTSGRRHKERVILAYLHAEQLSGGDQERLHCIYSFVPLSACTMRMGYICIKK